MGSERCAYEIVSGRRQWPNRDPIDEWGGINLYGFARNRPTSLIDLFGLTVDAVLDTGNKTLTITDKDTGKSTSASAFTGGRADKQCNVSVGPPSSGEIPVPKGFYLIGPDPKGRNGWYGVFSIDGRIDDYFDDKGTQRSGIRLHLGTWSQGCVTVCANQPDAKKKYDEIKALINNTKTEKNDFRDGPHWWNDAKEITVYGVLVVK